MLQYQELAVNLAAYTYVAVPGQKSNIPPHYRIRSALVLNLVQNFCKGWGSYALGKLMNTYHVHTACMSPALKGSSALECFEGSNVIEIRNGIMFDFTQDCHI